VPTSLNMVGPGPTGLQGAPQSQRLALPEAEVASTPGSVGNAAQLLVTAQTLRRGLPASAPPPPPGQIAIPENVLEGRDAVAQARNSFLVNAGSALLAQANSLPSGVLSLLRD
jgi:hypothetical protein